MRSIDKSVFIADGAQVIGNVVMGEDCSVWFNATIRADLKNVTIGKNTNIQDNAVIHTSKNAEVVLGNNITIGHGAIVHGCTIKDNVLVGMGAIILDHAEIGENCIIGAGALITQGKQIPPRSLVFGNPARIVRELTDEEIQSISDNALSYVHEAKEYIKTNLP